MSTTTLTKDQREDLMEELDLSPQVRKGIALLDEQTPDWIERMEVRDLDLRDCMSCALAQVFYEEWMVARAEYKAENPGFIEPWQNPYLYGQRRLKVDHPVEYGFDECIDPEDCGYDVLEVQSRSYYELTEEWANYVLRVVND